MIAEGTGTIPSIDSALGVSYKLYDTTYRSHYHYQSSMMPLALYAFRTDHEILKKSILEGYYYIQNRLKSLHNIRNSSDFKIIDEYFTDADLSGQSVKLIFYYTKENDESHIHHHGITTNQITAYLAFVTSLLSENHDVYNVKNYLKCIDYLVIDYLWMHSTEISAWHWTGKFKNKIDRIKYKLLNEKSKSRFSKKYHSAILDSEWWYFAIAAYTKTILKNLDLENKYDDKYIKNIDQILDLAKQTFVDRLSVDDYFYYQKGFWIDREQGDFTWHKYESNIFPAINNPPPVGDSVMLDTAHFHRMPWILMALRNSSDESFSFYDDLLRRLANHFVTKVIYYEDIIQYPLVSTFFDGTNGWYRLNFQDKWGFGPGSGSYCLMDCSWFLLKNYHREIDIIYEKLQNIMESKDPDIILNRKKYYGKINHPYKNKKLIRGDVDICDSNSFNYHKIKSLNKYSKYNINVDINAYRINKNHFILFDRSMSFITKKVKIFEKEVLCDHFNFNERKHIFNYSPSTDTIIDLTLLNELKSVNMQLKSSEFKKSIFSHFTGEIKNILSTTTGKNIWFGSVVDLTNDWYFNEDIGIFWCQEFKQEGNWLYSDIYKWIFCNEKYAPFFYIYSLRKWAFQNFNNSLTYVYDYNSNKWQIHHLK